MREDAERAFSDAHSAVAMATESIHVLPQGVDTLEARQVLDSDLENLRGLLAGSARLLKEDRLAEASEAAVEVREEAEAIVLDVQRAAAALPRASARGELEEHEETEEVVRGQSGGFARL